MGNVETAKLLSYIGGILSLVFGTIYLIWGIVQALILPWWWFFAGMNWIIYGIICLIFGPLTLFMARPHLTEGEDLKTGAIMCFIFGGISSGAIGGILTIVAGILAIIAWNEQRKAAVPAAPAAAPPKPKAAVAFCAYCGAELLPGATFCPSCGKKVKK